MIFYFVSPVLSLWCVTFEGVVTYFCDEVGGSFPCLSTCCKPTFLSLQLWKMLSLPPVLRDGTETISSTGPTLMGIPRGPVKLNGELTGYTAGNLSLCIRKCAIMKFHSSQVVFVEAAFVALCYGVVPMKLFQTFFLSMGILRHLL